LNKFTVKLILFTVSILLIVTSVNYYGDAGDIFHKGKVAQIAKYLVEGYNVANVDNIDERDLQRNIIKLSKINPSVIVLGSSRIMLIHSDYFKTNSFMNHGVSGASIEDMIAIYQLYKIKGLLPQKILIGVDPWIFNKNNGQSRWNTLAVEYESFFSSKTSVKNLFTPFDKYYQLFSPSYFQSSIKILIKQVLNRKQKLPLPTKLKVNDGGTRLSDGSISYNLEYRNVTIQDIDKKAKYHISGNIYALERYTSFDEKYLHLFNMFVDEILSNNIEVEFILMPYHPLVYDFLVSKKDYKIVIDFEKYIKDYAGLKNIPVTGSLNPHLYNLNSFHFYDGMHLNEKGVDAVLGK